MGIFLDYMIILELGEMPDLIICLNLSIHYHYQIKILLIWVILIRWRAYFARRELQGSWIGAVKRKKRKLKKKRSFNILKLRKT